MIKTKNLVILAAVLLVLGGVSFMQKSQHQKDTNSSATELLTSGDFNLDNISRLSLGFGANHEAVVLVAGPDGWLIESHHSAGADEQRITTLLHNFSNLAGEFRSDSGKILGEYGLQDDQAVTVRGLDKSGTEVLAINLGRTPRGFQGQFMRTPESNKVYLSQAALLSNLGIYGEPETPKVQFFLNLQACKESLPDLDGMKLRDGETTLAFTKKFSVTQPAEGAPEGTLPATDRSTWQWLLDGKLATDLAKTKIDRLLGSGASIRANDVANPTVPKAEYGLDNPARVLTLIRQDGSEMVLEFGNSREAVDDLTAGTYMIVSGQPTIWVVTDYTVKNIFKSRDDLKTE